MKFLFGVVLSLVLAGNANAMSQVAALKAEFNFNHGQNFSAELLGTKVFRDGVHDAVAQYDFTKDGGAIAAGGFSLRFPSTKSTAGGPKSILPKGAVIINCFIDVITPLTTSAGGTMALGTGQSQVDLKAAFAAASYTGLVACIPTGVAATAIKMTQDGNITATIATGAITAGKFNLHVLYVLSEQ